MNIKLAIESLNNDDPSIVRMYDAHDNVTLKKFFNTLAKSLQLNRFITRHKNEIPFMRVYIKDLDVTFVPTGVLFLMPIYYLTRNADEIKWNPVSDYIYTPISDFTNPTNLVNKRLVPTGFNKASNMDTVADRMHSALHVLYDINKGNTRLLDELVGQFTYVKSFLEGETRRIFAHHHQPTTKKLVNEVFKFCTTCDVEQFKHVMALLRAVNEVTGHFYVDNEGFVMRTEERRYVAYVEEGKVIAELDNQDSEIYKRYQLAINLAR